MVKNIRVAVVSAIGPWVGAYVATTFFLGLTFQEGVVAGAVFTATALPFTLGLLRAKGLIHTPAAKSAIAASTTDDVLASLLGTFTAILLAAAVNPAAKADAGTALLVLGKMGMVLFFFASIWVVSVLISPKKDKHSIIDIHRFNKIYYEHQITPSFIILLLATIVFFGEMIFHVHYAIGALMAGILFKRDLFFHPSDDDDNPDAPTFKNFEITMVPLVNNIEPFFYIYLGLHLNFSTMSMDAIIAGVVIFACVAFLQWLSAFSSGRWIGLDSGNAVLLGICMLPRDVIAFVVLSMNAAALPDDSVLFLASIVSIALLNLLAAVGLQLYKLPAGSQEKA